MRSGATLTHARSVGNGGAAIVSTGGRLRRPAPATPPRAAIVTRRTEMARQCTSPPTLRWRMSTPETPPPAGGDDAGRGLSGVQRAGIVLGGLAVLLIAFVVIRGGDDSGDRSSSSAAKTTQSRAPGTQSSSGQSASAATTTNGGAETETESETGDDSPSQPGPTSTAAPAVPAAQTINVVNGQPQGGVKTVSFKKG